MCIFDWSVEQLAWILYASKVIFYTCFKKNNVMFFPVKILTLWWMHCMFILCLIYCPQLHVLCHAQSNALWCKQHILFCAFNCSLVKNSVTFCLTEWQECRLYCCSGSILYFFSRMQKKKIYNGLKNFSINVKNYHSWRDWMDNNILQS